jgi:hypothetical protein
MVCKGLLGGGPLLLFQVDETDLAAGFHILGIELDDRRQLLLRLVESIGPDQQPDEVVAQGETLGVQPGGVTIEAQRPGDIPPAFEQRPQLDGSRFEIGVTDENLPVSLFGQGSQAALHVQAGQGQLPEEKIGLALLQVLEHLQGAIELAGARVGDAEMQLGAGLFGVGLDDPLQVGQSLLVVAAADIEAAEKEIRLDGGGLLDQGVLGGADRLFFFILFEVELGQGEAQKGGVGIPGDGLLQRLGRPVQIAGFGQHFRPAEIIQGFGVRTLHL